MEPRSKISVRFGGVRGSVPVNGAAFLRYGGATSSFLIEDADSADSIIIDAGTGLAAFAPNANGRLLMLFTHFHLDHLIGLTHFSRLATAGGPVTLAAPKLENQTTIRKAVKRLVAPPFWPVTPFDTVRFETRVPTSFGAFDIATLPLPHPNGCTGYRVTHRASGTALVVATDMEWTAFTKEGQQRFLDFCAAPTVLIMDGQFDDADGPRYQGWGHSTWQACARVAKACGAQQLFITHHAPEADDNTLDARQAALDTLLPGARLARAGESWNLGGNT